MILSYIGVENVLLNGLTVTSALPQQAKKYQITIQSRGKNCFQGFDLYSHTFFFLTSQVHQVTWSDLSERTKIVTLLNLT